MSALTALDDVKGYMEFWGWSAGGAPGSVKQDDDGRIIALYGDAQWVADVQRACDTLGRLHDRLTGNGEVAGS